MWKRVRGFRREEVRRRAERGKGEGVEGARADGQSSVGRWEEYHDLIHFGLGLCCDAVMDEGSDAGDNLVFGASSPKDSLCLIECRQFGSVLFINSRHQSWTAWVSPIPKHNVLFLSCLQLLCTLFITTCQNFQP